MTQIKFGRLEIFRKNEYLSRRKIAKHNQKLKKKIEIWATLVHINSLFELLWANLYFLIYRLTLVIFLLTTLYFFRIMTDKINITRIIHAQNNFIFWMRFSNDYRSPVFEILKHVRLKCSPLSFYTHLKLRNRICGSGFFLNCSSLKNRYGSSVWLFMVT